MTRKAMASDFDGTLYFMLEKEPMKRTDLEAINSFRAKGNLFGVCTGRSLRGVLDFVGEDFFDFYIVASGALILDKDFKEISKTCIPFEIMREIYEAYDGKVRIIIQANDNVYSLKEKRPYMGHIETLEDLLDADIYGLSFGTDSPAEAEEIAAILQRQYGDILNAFANVRNVDIVSKDCSKGSAIEKVKDTLGITFMAGIGDSYNDIPMLHAADYSFTFENSPMEAKNAANRIVDSISTAIGQVWLDL